MKLETKNLILRPFNMSDCPRIAFLCEDERVTRYTPLPSHYKLSDAENWVKSQPENKDKALDFAIVEKKTGELIGSISLMFDKVNNFAEMGYWLTPDFWGKGLATEVCKYLIEYAFKILGLHKIIAKHYIENPASGKVMQHCGMKFVGTLKEHNLKNGIYHDVNLYEIINQN